MARKLPPLSGKSKNKPPLMFSVQQESELLEKSPSRNRDEMKDIIYPYDFVCQHLNEEQQISSLTDHGFITTHKDVGFTVIRLCNTNDTMSLIHFLINKEEVCNKDRLRRFLIIQYMPFVSKETEQVINEIMNLENRDEFEEEVFQGALEYLSSK